MARSRHRMTDRKRRRIKRDKTTWDGRRETEHIDLQGKVTGRIKERDIKTEETDEIKK